MGKNEMAEMIKNGLNLNMHVCMSIYLSVYI